MNVHPTKHFAQTEFTRRPEAAPPIPFAGIPEGAKKHVPHGKVGIVEGVDTFLMMYAVAFRSLKYESEPTRSFYIPMINEFGQAAEHDCTRGGHRFNANTKIQNNAHDQTIEQNFKWMFVKARDHLEALRAMVHLMNPPPKERRS